MPCRAPRPRRVAVCFLATLLAGCGTYPSASPDPSPSPVSVSSSSTSPTPLPSWAPSVDPKVDLFIPGQAQQVISGLSDQATGPIVRVSLTRTSAQVTYVAEGDRPATVTWDSGEVSTGDEGTDLVTATPFDPADFDLSDVAALFTRATEISGSSENQQLQINEYNQGQILITVTTYPETTTVFFTADGTLIPRLDLTDDEDLAKAIADVTRGEAPNALIITADQQVAADYQLADGIVERRTRPANGPVYTTRRKEEISPLTFDQDQLDVATLGVIVRTYPGMLSRSKDSPITLNISRRLSDPAPRIRVEVGGEVATLRLDGTRVDEP